MEIRDLLLLSIKHGASDLHLTENEPPILRLNGNLFRTKAEIIKKEDLKRMIYSILSNYQKELFEKDLELDFSLALPGLDRFRVNVHIQKGCVEAAFRRIPLQIPTIEGLGLPPIISDLARKPNGLVLITGPTGMGKTTTLAAMINLINKYLQFKLFFNFFLSFPSCTCYVVQERRKKLEILIFFNNK